MKPFWDYAHLSLALKGTVSISDTEISVAQDLVFFFFFLAVVTGRDTIYSLYSDQCDGICRMRPCPPTVWEPVLKTVDRSLHMLLFLGSPWGGSFANFPGRF